MASRVNTLADAIVAAIRSGLTANDETEIERSYYPDVVSPDFDWSTIGGKRRVYVTPFGYGQVDNYTRGQDLNEYRVGVLVVRRFADEGNPPREWIDGEMDWTETYVLDRLDNERTAVVPSEIATVAAYVDTAEVVMVYEPGELMRSKLFWSGIDFAFRKAEA